MDTREQHITGERIVQVRGSLLERDPLAPQLALENMVTVGVLYGVLVELVRSGKVQKEGILSIMASQGSAIYRMPEIRRMARQLGFNEDERRGIVTQAFIDATGHISKIQEPQVQAKDQNG